MQGKAHAFYAYICNNNYSDVDDNNKNACAYKRWVWKIG
jgi:hypothetical protein